MSNFHLDDTAYNALLDMLNNQHFVEKSGQDTDMDFLTDDWWLRDTAVIENIVKGKACGKSNWYSPIIWNHKN
ncbi:MAG: hypothetical protein R2788_04340 [Saprospiraceae bacterium]